MVEFESNNFDGDVFVYGRRGDKRSPSFFSTLRLSFPTFQRASMLKFRQDRLTVSRINLADVYTFSFMVRDRKRRPSTKNDRRTLVQSEL